MHSLIKAVLFDVDGTLLDSNDAHTASWTHACRSHGVEVTPTQVRRLVGMGGDKLIPAVASVSAESALGRTLTQSKKADFERRLPLLRPTRGARRLVEYLVSRGVTVVIATSADDREMHALLKQAGVDDLFPTRASKDDAARSKPDPDIVRAALAKADAAPEHSVLVGDTPYDIDAAKAAHTAAVALRSGGYWSDDDLAGAIEIHDDPQQMLERWKTTRL